MPALTQDYYFVSLQLSGQYSNVSILSIPFPSHLVFLASGPSALRGFLPLT